MTNETLFEELEKKYAINFKNKNLLKQAFTHRSYINENQNETLEHNERLEYLGDAVLELVVTEYLYKYFPKKPEWELTAIRAALVNTQMLSARAEELGFNEHLLLSKGEEKSIGRPRAYILANTFEALVGALYLDGGYDTAQEFITRIILPYTDEIVEKKLWQDSKSRFQEKAQEERGITPTYAVVKETGPDHAKIFTIGLFLEETKIAVGEGPSKQEAEQDAAQEGLLKMGWE